RGDEIAVGGLEHDDDDDEREDDRERPELALLDPADERADQSLAGDPLIGDEGVAGHRGSPLRAALWVTTLSLAPAMAATSTSVRSSPEKSPPSLPSCSAEARSATDCKPAI